MESSNQKEKGNKKVLEINTFTVPFTLEEKKNITITTNTHSKQSKDQLINQALKFHSEGNISEAAKYYQLFISQGFKDHRVFSNYGVILKNLGKLKEAALLHRKALNIKPDFVQALYNLGIILTDLGELKESEYLYRKAIKIKSDDAEILCNLGSLLSDIGQLKEAEFYTRKAIEYQPNDADAHYNLGNILRDLGNLKESELSILRTIELNPDFTKGYFALSTLPFSDYKNIWQDKLFSESILKRKSQKDKVNIYFARANILHKGQNYIESARYLKLANALKLELKPSKYNDTINKSKLLINESNQKEFINKQYNHFHESIFIVGMPRCGSTLLESILSTSNDVHDLGEINILEESFFEWKKSKEEINLAELYEKKINKKTKLNITTNKYLYNYQYAGIIAKHLPNAKIIHSYRNPLDNILSIYRANFAKGNHYSSSLVDSAYVYINQDEIMTEYKNRYRSNIYDLNYDFLVRDPYKEIKSLICWLGWRWDDKYLSPHLNPRSVSTASNVQVRSPINSKSIGGWKNYKEMLKPAIEILAQTDKYKDIIS